MKQYKIWGTQTKEKEIEKTTFTEYLNEETLQISISDSNPERFDNVVLIIRDAKNGMDLMSAFDNFDEGEEPLISLYYGKFVE